MTARSVLQVTDLVIPPSVYDLRALHAKQVFKEHHSSWFTVFLFCLFHFNLSGWLMYPLGLETCVVFHQHCERNFPPQILLLQRLHLSWKNTGGTFQVYMRQIKITLTCWCNDNFDHALFRSCLLINLELLFKLVSHASSNPHSVCLLVITWIIIWLFHTVMFYIWMWRMFSCLFLPFSFDYIS